MLATSSTIITAFALAGSMLAIPAGAVSYLGGGTISLISGVDSANLDGATYEIDAIGDPARFPTRSWVNTELTEARFVPLSYVISVSNRPNGAADFVRIETLDPSDPVGGDSLLATMNWVAGFGQPDSFMLIGRGAAQLDGHFISFAHITAEFFDSAFFSDDGVAPIPAFLSSDVSSVWADEISARLGCCNAPLNHYSVLDPFLVVVPEPTTAVLLGLGLAGLAMRRRGLGMLGREGVRASLVIA